MTSLDEELLTPAHFLFGVTSIKGVLTPPRIFCDQLTRAWRHQRRVCEHLLRRWTSEYVAALRSWSVSPRGRPTRVPSVGDVVLVSGEGPRGRWPLALVTELIAGRDGKARAAFIKMNGQKDSSSSKQTVSSRGYRYRCDYKVSLRVNNNIGKYLSFVSAINGPLTQKILLRMGIPLCWYS